MQDAIEAMLQQKLGLDASSVGPRLIERAVSQRQNACHLSDRAAYLDYLRSSPQEMNQLIEAVVVPETWFFRDKGPFDYLQQHLKTQFLKAHAGEIFRVLSLPCSTGEEPYSIAIALLEAGLPPNRFRVDAIDISQKALLKAQQGLYRKKSFRGDAVPNLERYFQLQPEGYGVRSIVRQSVHFSCGNVLEPHFLVGKQYHAIFCRNLLIYLDQPARNQVIDSLDRALMPLGLLFLGAAETAQMLNRSYKAIDHPFAFAYQKLPAALPVAAPAAEPKRAGPAKTKGASDRQSCSVPVPAPVNRPFANSGSRSAQFSSPNPLDSAKQLADRGELMKAAQMCEAFLRQQPTQANAHILLGEIYQGLNQPQQAERCFQRAIYLDPNAYAALIHLGLLKEQQGNRAEAERLKKRAQRLADRANQSESG